MIIFERDFVRLRNRKKWVQVVEIKYPHEYREELVLSNNRVVPATWRYIEEVRSENEHYEAIQEERS